MWRGTILLLQKINMILRTTWLHCISDHRNTISIHWMLDHHYAFLIYSSYLYYRSSSILFLQLKFQIVIMLLLYFRSSSCFSYLYFILTSCFYYISDHHHASPAVLRVCDMLDSASFSHHPRRVLHSPASGKSHISQTQRSASGLDNIWSSSMYYS